MKFTASVPGELSYRDLVGASVRGFSLRVERDRGCVGLEWRLISAFNEAFNNIVEHAYARVGGEVEVYLAVEADVVILRLSDFGAGFNLDASGASQEPPEFDALSEGGMGLFIIRQAMTEVTYERRHDRNLLTMTKRLSECSCTTARPGAGVSEGSRC